MADPKDHGQGGMTPADPTVEPLFGASPPPDADANAAGAVSDGTTSSAPHGDPAPSIAAAAISSTATGAAIDPLKQYMPTPRQYTLDHGVYHPKPRTTPARSITFLRRLAFLLSLFLGVSASVAGIWSYFVLPLLHSSFSARKALVDQQVSRVRGLVEGLTKVRSSGIYPARPATDAKDGEGATPSLQKHLKPAPPNPGSSRPAMHRGASLKEIDSSASVSSASSQPMTASMADTASTPIPHPDNGAPVPPLLPLDDLETLSMTLRSLTAALDSTSTTRTSLISTLESYTSHLHREMFVARHPASVSSSSGGRGRPTTGGFGGYSIGGTLGESLSRAGAGAGAGHAADTSSPGVRGEDWDAVRKEIRAIKGVLLNRRTLAQPV
ncbi:hypothetical protein IAU60_004882 [Kwoniella sp. DSM 27419]